MANETFVYSGQTLTFGTTNARGRLLGGADIIEANQVIVRTIGGTTMVDNLGDERKLFEYDIIVPKSSGETDYADLLSFFSSTYVNYGQKSFVWTDYASVARTVKAINSIFRFGIDKSLGDGLRTLRLILEEQ